MFENKEEREYVCKYYFAPLLLIISIVVLNILGFVHDTSLLLFLFNAIVFIFIAIFISVWFFKMRYRTYANVILPMLLLIIFMNILAISIDSKQTFSSRWSITVTIINLIVITISLFCMCIDCMVSCDDNC